MLRITQNDIIHSAIIMVFLPILGLAEPQHEQAQRPNILLILADDMGFSDIGCYGGEIDTPNLDKLAAKGLRFTQFYNAARCCPTRASLLTGLHPAQAGMRYMQGPRMKGYYGSLSVHSVTIAEVLKQAGYATYMCGKWHVAGKITAEHFEDKADWPSQRGFDEFYGTIAGDGSYYHPRTLTRNNDSVGPHDDHYYYTDAISDQIVQFIDSHQESKSERPYFMYVAYTAPHFPLHAPKEDIAKYRGKYMKGWNVIRQERYTRLVDMGIIDSEWTCSPMDPANYEWDELDEAKKRDMDLRMAIYAAMIEIMDRGIGRIVQKLEETGQLDNTLIFFLSDNGACHEPNLLGVDKKGFSLGDGKGEMGGPNSHAQYGQCWANASNTPFRRYKMWIHEGGIATPLIVHWPRGIKAEGELRHQVGHDNDIMATCVDVAGATYPKTYQGKEIVPCEGLSLLPVFEDKARHYPALGWEHQDNRGLRKGKWKLVAIHKGPWELYDMEADRTELHDLADQYPGRVEELANEYDRWAERCGVTPWQWPTRSDMIPLPPRR